MDLYGVLFSCNLSYFFVLGVRRLCPVEIRKHERQGRGASSSLESKCGSRAVLGIIWQEAGFLVV